MSQSTPVQYISQNGIAQGINKEGFWNNTGRGERYIDATGPAANILTVGEMNKYMVGIDDNWKAQVSMKMTFKAIIENLSPGTPIRKYFISWTDEYKSEGQIVDIPFDKLRHRDFSATVDNYSGIGSYTEIGGKMMWQWAAYSADGASEETETTANINAFPTLYASAPVNNIGGCVHIGSSTAVVGDATHIAGIVGEMKETSLVPMNYAGITRNCMTFGFSRNADYITGKASDVTRTIQSVCRAKNYAFNTSNNTKWKDGTNVTTPTTYTYTYIPGTSKRVLHLWDQLYTAGVITATQLDFMNKTVVTMGLQQFSFTHDHTKFILVFDANHSNLDMSYDLTPYNASNPTIPANTWIQVTKGTITYSTGNTATVGKIVKTGTGVGTASDANQCVNVPVAFLIEEVNTSTLADGSYVAKNTHHNAGIFAKATAGTGTAGWSRMSGHLVLNLHNDVPRAVGSAQEFNLTKLKNGIYREGVYTRSNNIQLFQSEPWMIEKMRLSTDIQYGDTIDQDRQWYHEEFQRDINNAMLFGKKTFVQKTDTDVFQNYEISNPVGSYAGTMAGLLSYEDFALSYVKYPWTITADMALSTAASTEAYGIQLTKFLEGLGDALSFNQQPGMYKGSSLLCSRYILQALGITKRRIDSSQSLHGNIFGGIVYKPANEANMYIENFEYVTSRGHTLRFTYDPSLDSAQHIDVPQFLLGRANKNAQLNPRWCIVAIDRNHIKTYSHAAYPTKIFGGLQPNNNVNIVAEGLQGSATLEVRFPKQHMIIDLSND